MSLGLTLSNIPNGIGAGILHIDIWLLGALNFVASLLMLGIGLQVGRRGVHWLGRMQAMLLAYSWPHWVPRKWCFDLVTSAVSLQAVTLLVLCVAEFWKTIRFIAH